MYVAKFDREGLFWKATLFQKEWSEPMYTHQVKEVSSKKFIFRSRCYRWIYKEIGKALFSRRELEIIDG